MIKTHYTLSRSIEGIDQYYLFSGKSFECLAILTPRDDGFHNYFMVTCFKCWRTQPLLAGPCYNCQWQPVRPQSLPILEPA